MQKPPTKINRKIKRAVLMELATLLFIISLISLSTFLDLNFPNTNFNPSYILKTRGK